MLNEINPKATTVGLARKGERSYVKLPAASGAGACIDDRFPRNKEIDNRVLEGGTMPVPT